MEKLETLYGSFNVYLNKLPSVDGLFFHVSFVDRKNKVHCILMRYHSGLWTITEREKHPAWVLALEERLRKLVLNVVHDYYLPKAV